MGILGAVLVMMSALAAPAANAPAASKSEADKMWEDVIATYRAMSTYSDHGTSVTRYKRERPPNETVVTFETHYKRPGKLKFRWTLQPKVTAATKWSEVGSNGEQAWLKLATAPDKPAARSSLAVAVEGARGNSHWTAAEIPRILDADIAAKKIVTLKNKKLAGSAFIDGKEYVILTAQDETKAERKVWVGKTDHIIRKVLVTEANGTTREEERLDIKVNETIPEATFAGE